MARQFVYALFGLIALSLGLVQCAHNPHAISMDVSPSVASLTSVGQTVQFEAFGDILTGTHSSTGNLTDQVTWSSSSTSVATINSSGLATAVSAGTTTITATLGPSTGGILEATATLTVGGAAIAPRDLASITIVPSSQTVSNIGEPIQFAAVGNYSAPPTAVELTTSQVTWSSSDTTIATISSAGLATSVGPGTATIIATATAPISGATIIGSATLTVSSTAVPRDLVSITIIPNTQSLSAVGALAQLTAIGNYSGSPTTVQLTPQQVTWGSNDVTVATVNSAGLVTSVGGGTATITATATANSGATIVGVATLTVTVPTTVQRDLTSITIIPSSQNTTTVGEPVQFTAIGNYNASPTTVDLTGPGMVTWKSSDTFVATMNSSTGLATSANGGTTTITASAIAPVSGATIIGTATLAVSSTAVPTDLTSITIIPSSQTVTSVGETNQFIAIGNYSNGAPTQNLTTQATWQPSDVTVATINSTGLATAVSGGSTTIEASFKANSGALITGIATLSVSANAVTRDLTSITIIPSSQTVDVAGESAQFIAIGNYSGSPTTVDLTNQVTWQSSILDVATINSTGLAIAANNAGNTTITASATANSGATIVGTAELTQALVEPPVPVLLPTLTVFELGAGSGTVVSSATATTQAGLITCPSTSAANSCTASFPLGTTVTLTATAADGSTFGGWSANCTPVTATSCEVVMNVNEPVAAIFNVNQP